MGKFVQRYFSGKYWKKKKYSVEDTQPVNTRAIVAGANAQYKPVVVDEYESKPDNRALPEYMHSLYGEVLDFRLDIVKMADIMMMEENEFHWLGVTEHVDKDMFYTFIDRDSDILAVAHLDSVQKPEFPTVVNYHGFSAVKSMTVDDRVGAYLILELLPKLGISCDVLLTTGEESGQSTAQFFKSKKDYKWMFSFDRMGTDVVMYQYHDNAWKDRLAEFDLPLEHGSFSDICYLDDLKVTGFNFGTAYYNNHGKKAVVVISELVAQVVRFKFFYEKYKTEKLPYTPVPRYSNYLYRGNWEDDWSLYNNYYTEQRMDVMCFCGAHIVSLKDYQKTKCVKCSRVYGRSGSSVSIVPSDQKCWKCGTLYSFFGCASASCANCHAWIDFTKVPPSRIFFPEAGKAKDAKVPKKASKKECSVCGDEALDEVAKDIQDAYESLSGLEGKCSLCELCAGNVIGVYEDMVKGKSSLKCCVCGDKSSKHSNMCIIGDEHIFLYSAALNSALITYYGRGAVVCSECCLDVAY